MMSNNWEGSDEGITADDDANEAAVEHIREKAKIGNWDLDSLMTETLIKGMVDSKCFIRTWPNQEAPNTLDVDMLAYDNHYYNFIELIDPTSGELLGYKQKATIYPIPGNWEDVSFDSLANLMPEEDEASFQPNEVIHPKYLERDKKADSIVYKVLDYVDIKRELENMIPVAVRNSAVLLGIRIGGPDIDLGISNESEAQEKASEAANTFKERYKKEIIAHFYGTEPYPIGTGQLPDFTTLFDYLKQEIRQALFTPDSKFESASSNRAVAQEQLSGAMGMGVIIDYNQAWLRKYFEHQLFARELSLAGYQNDIGKIHLTFPEPEVEDEFQLAQIAEKLEASYPSVSDEDRTARLQTYFQPYYTLAQGQGIDLTTPEQQEAPLGGAVIPEVLPEQGILQNSMPYSDMVKWGRKILKKEGVVN
jgi:hypothetical protein